MELVSADCLKVGVCVQLQSFELNGQIACERI